MVDYYTPNFQPPGWRDNVDLVSADGPNGFNVQFSNLQKEFNTISTCIHNIIDVLKTVHLPTVLALTPNLVTIDPHPWQHDEKGYAKKIDGNTSARGMMSVDLPNGVKIESLRASGINASGAVAGTGRITISLKRQKIFPDGSEPEVIVGVTAQGTPQFDIKVSPEASKASVATNLYTYFILAELTNAQDHDVVQLNAFQIHWSLD